MKFIVKLFPEITIKSKSVRQRMTKVLQGNVRNVLRRVDPGVRVRMDWDKLVVSSDNDAQANRDALVEILGCTPGIQSFLEVQEYRYADLHEIYTLTAAVYGDKLEGEEKAKIEEAIKQLEDALKSDDKAAIDEKSTALMTASQKLGEHMYADAQAKEAAQGGGADAGASAQQAKTHEPDDNVVDAEVKEVKKD